MFKYILATIIIFFSSYVYSNENELTINQQLERLQREVSDLSKEVFSNSSSQSSGTNNDFVKNLSAIDLRIYDIENDIKNLTSNLEELYFQLDDIFNKLENLERSSALSISLGLVPSILTSLSYKSIAILFGT